MGEAETYVRSIGGLNQEAAPRRNERRRSKADVRNDEEAVGRTQKTAATLNPCESGIPSFTARSPVDGQL